MEAHTTPIQDVLVFESTIFRDERGYFMESFNQKNIQKILGENISFVQDNQSLSKKGVLRGLHYQIKHVQGKLVRVVRGKVFDVVVDLRKKSSTYGQWFGIELSADNQKQLWIPPGLAHGFLSLEDQTEFFYKTTDYWDPQSEQCLLWRDSTLNILWPIDQIDLLVNHKDSLGKVWNDAPKFE